MNQLRSIVVGVDFSRCSLKALAHAVRIARWNEARLHVLHVIDGLDVADLAEAVRAPLDEVRAQVARTAAHELEARVLEVGGDATIQVEIGPPIDEILKALRRVSADLLVVGANGGSEPHLGAGTLAVKCLRKATTKVLLVSAEAADSFRTIAACVDFSPASRVVVEQARRVALSEGSEIHCLHVYHPPWQRLHYLTPTAEVKPDIQTQYLAALHDRLEEFAGLNPTSAVRCALFPHARYGTGIVEYARQISADLIVLGTRGRTNLPYIMAGSTAEHLLRELPCSVLAVRAVESESGGKPALAAEPISSSRSYSDMESPA